MFDFIMHPLKTIRKWMLRVLGIQQHIDFHRRQISDVMCLQQALERDNSRLIKRVNLLESMLSIGVDVHYRDQSWAIICGKTKRGDVVRFVTFPEGETEEVIRFMEHFRFSNINQRIDAPMVVR